MNLRIMALEERLPAVVSSLTSQQTAATEPRRSPKPRPSGGCLDQLHRVSSEP